MREKEAGPDESRRDFLKLASIAVPAAAATSVTGTAAEASEVGIEASGLRKTKHVKAYLESARF